MWNWLFNLTEVVDDDRDARRKIKEVLKSYSKAGGLPKLVPNEITSWATQPKRIQAPT